MRVWLGEERTEKFEKSSESRGKKKENHRNEHINRFFDIQIKTDGVKKTSKFFISYVIAL